MESNKNTKINYSKLIILVVCALVYAGLISLPAPKGLPVNGQRALALMVVAVIAWVTEVIPIGVSSVLLTMLLATLKIVTIKEAMSNFMITTVFFIFASFIIAATFIKTGLGNRISLIVSSMFGDRPDRVLLSFMLPTALVSTILADIPTAIIFSGIAYTLLKKNDCLPGKSNFGKSIMVGIPIAAAIGGIGTPAGSGLNVLAISLIKSAANVDVNFLQWTAIGLPMAIVLVFVAWFVLKTMYPAEFKHVKGLDDVKKDLKELGAMTADEKKFTSIFAVTLILWFTQPFTKLDTALVAVVTASVFFIPGISLCLWDDVKGKIAFDVLFLVGASNALAMAIVSTKAAAWISSTFLGGLAGLGVFALLLAVTAFGIFSHLLIPAGSAVLAIAIPVLSILATKIGVSPIALCLPVAFTASCVFLMPLDPIPLTTYDYKYWKMPDMIKPGIFIALIWIIINAVFMYGAQLIGIY
jgi:solute carrier family 13 (sodium-dependent dicarboxylate transporter), member 2/3/5